MPDEIAAVRERVCLLEAREACVSTLNEYLHYLDGEFTDDLLALFTPDAQLEVMNYPCAATSRSVPSTRSTAAS
jgi:hypothetical protein